MLTNYEDIVNNFRSPTLVLAGPGAGKTHILADRINRLLKNESSKNKIKDTICVLAFGNDAVQRMKDELTNPKGDWKLPFLELPRILTTHSLGLEIVKEKPSDIGLLKTDLEVQENRKVQELMYRDAAFILDFTEENGKEAGKCKRYGDCQGQTSKNKCKVCMKYREVMSKCNRIDFDDQLLFACEILENNPAILKKYQEKAKHLLIDEYQDFNAAQFRLIELLSRESRNGLFVVGDDAQSIYGFRGGNPKFILRFCQDFSNAELGYLPYNHRCPKGIMRIALTFLQQKYPEYKGIKNVDDIEFTNRSENAPYIWESPSELKEAAEVAKIARSSLEEGKTVLILVPKKDLFPLIIKKLREYHVPYNCDENFVPDRINVANLFMEWIGKREDNFRTRLIIEQLINAGIAKVPGMKKNGRCSPETIKKRVAEEKKIAKLWERVDKHNNLFSVIANHEETCATFIKIRDGFNSLINSYVSWEEIDQGEFVKQLSAVSGIWGDPSKIIEDLGLVSKLLLPQEISVTRIASLRTMKKAKGLQADVVMVVSLENDIVPDRRNDVVEEARLFYVSMTRAQQSLYLFHSSRRPCDISYSKSNLEKVRSMFLNDLGLPSTNQFPTSSRKI
jgi:DNA helicase-2/ATP-dependent DNA helicase PcrA